MGCCLWGRIESDTTDPLLIATGEAIPLRGLEGVPFLPGAPQESSPPLSVHLGSGDSEHSEDPQPSALPSTDASTPPVSSGELANIEATFKPSSEEDFHITEPPSLSPDTEPSEDVSKPKLLEPTEASATELIAQEEIEIFQNSDSTTSVQVSGETVKVFPGTETPEAEATVTAASETKLEGATLRPHSTSASVIHGVVQYRREETK